MSNIPKQKHNDKELSELRARSAMQSSTSPIAMVYNKKLAHRATVVLGYMLPMTSPVWASVKVLTKDNNYQMSDVYIMVIPILLALILALWITLKRVLSRHNAAFIFIISMLSCFPIVKAVDKDKNLRYDLMSLMGMEASVPESDGSGDAESGIDNLSADEIREMLRKEEERIQRQYAERQLNQDVTPETPGN